MTDATAPDLFRKPTVIGLYGVPGCGKSYLLRKLKAKLDENFFAFYEGSQVIDRLVPGGLEAFKLLNEKRKRKWRREAIESIQKDCFLNEKTAIVTGHYMFWQTSDAEGSPVITSSDLIVYTHILYLDVPPHVVLRRQEEDRTRARPEMSVFHIGRWQEAEKSQLRDSCLNHGILFFRWTEQGDMASLILDLNGHHEEKSLRNAKKHLDTAMAKANSSGCLEKVLVLDADRTLTVEDTGNLWWKEFFMSKGSQGEPPLIALFGKMGYSYEAFWQATLTYEEAAGDAEFDKICQRTADAVSMYPQMQALLHLVSRNEHIHAVVLTSGLRLVWEKILARGGLSGSVNVIGGGRIADGLVVTPETKSALVSHLQSIYRLEVWAFGDSPLDIPMLREANYAIVVVGEESSRSKTMESALRKAITEKWLYAKQVLLPPSVAPRLNTTLVPVLDIMDSKFVDSLVEHRYRPYIIHATHKPAAKLLQTPMRDASFEGPALRNVHIKCGRYLALEYVSDIIGIESYSTPHVQGHDTAGHRLAQEKNTLIIALMRGGAPMAEGINDVFPTAEFLHAWKPEDVTSDCLRERSTVILVDSVINSGNSVVEFVEHIHSLARNIKIVVVTGVVQAQALEENGGRIPLLFSRLNRLLTIVALRISTNKFTGKRGTDTGNRLFNTKHLD
ncbi:uracil phosphoribosyltransferase [Aspergillus steynii IBT 23096]|uniref:Uracil phosphoribosyltransferase n=1 Tax=Aspergillus steynii IBT 23096 TaxID=1392250 RepID=A0A2I2GGY2_9EURO|nr:uracil phosphoribosyltransferase [Aspergillus steynii IBT 23096]PLB52141.1 uracil phosphoribosyltransferase [Aspergillus steynii IBT 23096]